MKYIVTPVLILLVSYVFAQDHWNNIPAFTSACYSDKDVATTQLHEHITRIEKQLEQLKQEQERSIQNMSEAERTQLAMKAATQYQNLSPDAIRKMQDEQLLMATLQQQNHTQEAAVLEKLTAAEKAFQEQCTQKLEPIMQEYRKLPDGEGTPDWAITKGKELLMQYNKEYEKICVAFITGPAATFKPLLEEFKNYLQKIAIPNNQHLLEFQMQQYGLPTRATNGVVLEGIKSYLNKIKEVYDLRLTYKQGV